MIVFDVRLEQRVLAERFVASCDFAFELVVVQDNHQLFRGHLDWLLGFSLLKRHLMKRRQYSQHHVATCTVRALVISIMST